MGGVAGGEKYLVEGIFFKFAIDAFGVYGGDDFAMKVRSNLSSCALSVPIDFN